MDTANGTGAQLAPKNNAEDPCMNENAPVGERVVTMHLLAEWTGLEPATPGVTGRYSNQLNYHSEILRPDWYLVGAEGFEPPTFAL